MKFQKYILSGLFLMGFVFVSSAAHAIEYYFASSTTQEQEASSTYNTHTSLTVDRSDEAGTKNFFVIAHIATSVDNVGATPTVRLYQNGTTTLGEAADGMTHDDTGTNYSGYTYNFVKRVSLTAASHTFEIQFAEVTGAGAENAQADNSSIVVIEETTNAEYAENTAETGTGANTSWVDGVTLTFTPGTQDDYMLFWAAEVKLEDEDDSGVDAIRFYESTAGLTQEYQCACHGELITSSNDNVYHTYGGVSFRNLTTVARTFKIQIDGDGTSDEAYIRNAAIVAIPYGDLENVYTDSQTANTTHTGTSFSTSDLNLASQAVNANDHLIIAGIEIGCEINTEPTSWQLNADGTAFRTNTIESRDSDNAEFFLNFMVYGQTMTAGNKTFNVQATSADTSTSREAVVQDGYLVIAEIDNTALNGSSGPKKGAVMVIN